MLKISHFYLLFALFFSIYSFGQKKTLKTNFVTEKISIDAQFDESAWKNAETATNFEEIFPTNGKRKL